MQKLLGKNYKWWYLIRFYFNSVKTNLTAFYVSQFSYISEALIIVFIWFQSSPNSDLLTYLLMGRVFRSIIASYYHTDLSNIINSGQLTNKLLLSSDFFRLEFFTNLGQRLAKNPPTILGLTVTAIVSHYIFTPLVFPEISDLLLLILALPLAFFLQFIMSFILGSLSFYLLDKRDVWAYHQAYERAFLILAGYFIPLDNEIIPNFLQKLPFSYIIYHPMQIYLDNYNSTQTLLVFLGGITWCLILYFLAKLVFKLGLKRNESVGL